MKVLAVADRAAYRFYLLNAEGHVVLGEWIAGCAADEDAVAEARRRLPSHDMAHLAHSAEVWQGSRRVSAFPLEPIPSGTGRSPR